jgi:hypothetical protein
MQYPLTNDDIGCCFFLKVCLLDDGSITVDCPLDKIPEKGYFTMFDGSQSAKGTLPMHFCCALHPSLHASTYALQSKILFPSTKRVYKTESFSQNIRF